MKKSNFNRVLLFSIIAMNVAIQIIIHIYILYTNDGKITVTDDAAKYLDVSYSIRNLSTKSHGVYFPEYKDLDIGSIIMPTYPFIIALFYENLHIISLFQTILLCIGLYYLFKVLTNKYLIIYAFITPIWIILSTSWSYHNQALIESSTISFNLILIYFLDKYFKNYNLKDFVYFSIVFGILIAINNRFIFHFSGFIPFLFFIKLFERRIKINHVFVGIFVVISILTPWHIRQYVVYGKFILFAERNNNMLEKEQKRDQRIEDFRRMDAYDDYLKDSLNHPLRNNPKELIEVRKLIAKRTERWQKDQEAINEMKKKGTYIEPMKIITYEPEKKLAIAINDDGILKDNKPNLTSERRNKLGLDNKQDFYNNNSQTTVVYLNNDNKQNSNLEQNVDKSFDSKQINRKKQKSNNQKISELITKVNKINNTNFETKDIGLFTFQLENIKLINKALYTKVIFDIINQADKVGLPDLKYSILGITKPIDSTLIAKKSELKAQNSQKIKKSTNKLTTNVDSLSYFTSSLGRGLNELKLNNGTFRDSILSFQRMKGGKEQNKIAKKTITPISENKQSKLDLNYDKVPIPNVDTNIVRPILIITNIIDTTNIAVRGNYLDSILVFPIFSENNFGTSESTKKTIVRYDTLNLQNAKQIMPDLNTLNPRQQVTIENGKNRILIENNKVAMIKVGDFENQKEFQMFENIRNRKLVPPYNDIIDALLSSHPKFGATPENLRDFLSDFSYSKYKQLVYDKFEPTNKYELIWNRFKEQFIFFRTDFRFTPQFDPRIYFPSHYNNWIQFILDLIMMPLVFINIIPLIIAIYKKDWLIISLGVLVFLHILLHALVGYIPRYRVTIYPVWITFAVYGYDQITRYIIHVYKNRADYIARVNRLLAAKKA